MNVKNVMTVLVVAALTAALTIAAASSLTNGTAEAGPTAKPTIVQPLFESQGCTFVMKTDMEAYEGKEHPVIEVTASNPSNQPVKATVYVAISGTSPLALASRMMPRAETFWKQDYAFDLGPNETKSQKHTCNVAIGGNSLTAKQNVRIVMGDSKLAVLANEFAIQQPNQRNANSAEQMRQNLRNAQPAGN
jgi:hypothetical protein